MTIRRLRRFLSFVVVAYVLVAVGVYGAQRSLQYHPDTTPPGLPADKGLSSRVQTVTLRAADGLDLAAWYAPARQGRPTVVYYHGNAGKITGRSHKMRDFMQKGYGFLLLEYRGYGGNAGQPSEQGFYTDARAAIAYLHGKGVMDRQIILYGESIGTGVATQMATEIKPAALILEAPFTSAADVARIKYFWLPVDLLLKDRFDNAAKISSVKAPLLILHGDADGVVPYPQGKALFALAGQPKAFESFAGGGHSNLYDFGAAQRVFKWLQARGL